MRDHTANMRAPHEHPAPPHALRKHPPRTENQQEGLFSCTGRAFHRCDFPLCTGGIQDYVLHAFPLFLAGFRVQTFRGRSCYIGADYAPRHAEFSACASRPHHPKVVAPKVRTPIALTILFWGTEPFGQPTKSNVQAFTGRIVFLRVHPNTQR